jgi:hypothetical protein
MLTSFFSKAYHQGKFIVKFFAMSTKPAKEKLCDSQLDWQLMS